MKSSLAGLGSAAERLPRMLDVRSPWLPGVFILAVALALLFAVRAVAVT